MALINCHECGNQVSDNAVACPKCGAPVLVRIRRRRKTRLILLAIELVFVAVVIFCVWLILHHLSEQVRVPLKH